MRKRQRILISCLLLLICVLSGLAGGEVSGQDIPPVPNSKAISDRPNDLEGNWFFEWSDYPTGDGKTRGAAVLRRQWKQERVEVIGGGGGGGYFNRVYPFDSPLTLEYTTDFRNWGGLTLQPSQQGSLEIPWGSWDGHASELKLKGRDELRGLARWTYLKSIGGNSYENVPLEGGEVWRRALPYIKRVVFNGVSFYDYSAQFTQYDDPSSTVESETTLGGRPGRVEGRYGSVKGWGPDNDMHGNRPKFKIQIYGENLWGHHLIDLGGAVDLEPLPYWTYIMKGGGRYSSLHNRVQEVEGIELEVVIWPKARPGRYAVRVDGISIPFDLVIKGHPGAAVTAPRQTGATQDQGGGALIFNGLVTFLLIALVAWAAIALPPIGLTIGAGLSGLSLWRSYSEGGWQQVWDDLTPHEFLELIGEGEHLSGWQRLGKFLMGSAKTAGLVTGMIGARHLSRIFAKEGRRVIQQGRRALGAARRRYTEDQYFDVGAASMPPRQPHTHIGKSARSVAEIIEERNARFARLEKGKISRMEGEDVGLRGQIEGLDNELLAKQAAETLARRESAKRELLAKFEDVNFVAQGDTNCVSCTIATRNAIKEGKYAKGTQAIPGEVGQRGGTTSMLEEHFGKTFQTVNGKSQIDRMLTKAGDGADGVVVVERAVKDPKTGEVMKDPKTKQPLTWRHSFNAVNHKGHILYPDGQIKVPPDSKVVNQYGGFYEEDSDIWKEALSVEFMLIEKGRP